MQEMISVDRECWGCLNLNVDTTKSIGKDMYICDEGHNIWNKTFDRCPGYEWDEVGDEDHAKNDERRGD